MLPLLLVNNQPENELFLKAYLLLLGGLLNYDYLQVVTAYSVKDLSAR